MSGYLRGKDALEHHFNEAVEAYTKTPDEHLVWYSDFEDINDLVAVEFNEIEEFVKTLDHSGSIDNGNGEDEAFNNFLKNCGAKKIDNIRSFSDNNKPESNKFIKNGWSALHIAADLKESEGRALKFLIEKGASIRSMNWNFQTPLSVAAKGGVLHSVEALIKKAREEFQDEDEFLAHIDALSRVGPDKKVLEKTALAHACGRSAGKWPMDKERVDVIKALLDAGANPETKFRFNHPWEEKGDPNYTLIHGLVYTARTADSNAETAQKVKQKEGKSEKQYCFEAIDAVIKKIPQGKREHHLNIKTKINRGGTIWLPTALDICDWLRQDKGDCCELRKMHDALIQNGARNSIPVDRFAELEKKIDNRFSYGLGKIRCEMKKSTFMALIEFSGVIGLAYFLYDITSYILSKEKPHIGGEKLLFWSALIAIGIVCATAIFCALFDHLKSKDQSLNSNPSSESNVTSTEPYCPQKTTCSGLAG